MCAPGVHTKIVDNQPIIGQIQASFLYRVSAALNISRYTRSLTFQFQHLFTQCLSLVAQMGKNRFELADALSSLSWG